MLTKETESMVQTLHAIGADLQKERERLLKIRANLDKIEKDHRISVIQFADRH